MRGGSGWFSKLLLLGVVGLLYGCAASRDRAAGDFVPNQPGVLVVAADLPSPGFWNGEDPAGPVDGFEWALAQALADRFGLTLRVADVPFERIESGDLGGADLALAQLSSTDERREVLTLSDPYYSTAIGVVMPAGTSLADLKGARELTWSVRASTTEADFLDTVVRPTAPSLVVESEIEAAAAVAAGSAEAALMDLVSALVITADQPALVVTAAFAEPQHYVVAMPRNSDNAEVVNQALKALATDGSLSRFEERWLDPVFSRDPSQIPVIRAR